MWMGRRGTSTRDADTARYGHLAWQHTLVQGLREVEKGTEFGGTPGDDFKFNTVTRVANLKMDETGQVTGKIDLSFSGADAVDWRHTALKGDEESLDHALRTHLEDMVPQSLQVKVDKIDNLTEYEQPLKVSYEVTGTLGNAYRQAGDPAVGYISERIVGDLRR